MLMRPSAGPGGGFVFLPVSRCSRTAVVNEISKREALELEERDRELADKVRSANFDHIKSKLDADMKLLSNLAPSKEKEAKATALDLKYLQQRQQFLA